MSKEFDHKVLDLAKDKRFYLYEYVSGFEKFKELPSKERFYSLLTGKKNIDEEYEDVYKDTLSGLRNVLAAEIPLKMMEDAFLFHLKVPFHSLYI